MKKNRLLSMLLAAVLVFTSVFSLNLIALADEITYNFEAETGTLTISGSGEMTNYDENTLTDRPWNVYADEIKKVVISEGVTSVGAYAFSRMPVLEEVEISSTVATLGNTAFSGNDMLNDITIPATVTTVEDFAFGFNFVMEVNEGFLAHCTEDSAALKYCFKNYIPFDAPMQDGAGTAYITNGGEQDMWSFVPKSNGTLTFWSESPLDTFGLIYDASNYIYSDKYSTMKASAKATGDDNGSDVNFKIIFEVKAGHRYYLAAKYMVNAYTGSFPVKTSFVCDEHTAGEPLEENRVEPTCTEAGSYLETITCTYCGAEISKGTKTIDPLGHSFTNYVSNDDATCTENATETAKCDRCDVTDTKTVENSALGHSYTTTVTNPTCTERGYTTYNCSACEHSYVGDYVDPLGHSFKNYVSNDDVTCTKDGTETAKCDSCDATDTRTVEGSAIGHAEREAVEENRIDATCENAGSYDLVVYCDNCEEELNRTPQVIEALGHDFAITAFADGVATVECQREECGEKYDLTFMDYYNTAVAEDEGAILDVNGDGFINAKDFAMMKKGIFTK